MSRTLLVSFQYLGLGILKPLHHVFLVLCICYVYLYCVIINNGDKILSCHKNVVLSQMFAIANDSPYLYLSGWDLPEGIFFLIFLHVFLKNKQNHKQPPPPKTAKKLNF